LQYWGLTEGTLPLEPSALPLTAFSTLIIFQIGLLVFAHGWPQKRILPISASQEVGIINMNYCCTWPSRLFLICTMNVGERLAKIFPSGILKHSQDKK
jgi:hypothetical protein